MMVDTEHEVLTFLDFPKEHRVKIHSTNVLERLNGEIKRRANVVGIFPNEGAVRRLVGALLMEQNDEYAIQNRYMSLESLATMSEIYYQATGSTGLGLITGSNLSGRTDLILRRFLHHVSSFVFNPGCRHCA